LKKKNTFTDFIACAKHFIQQGWTSPQQLAVRGRSAGGLLMGAVTTTASDIANVVWMQVPYVDVINDLLDATIPWTVYEYDEWGNPYNKTFFDYMLSYDPYQNVKPISYPNIMVQSGWNDPIVGYWEGTKFVALLRHTKIDNNTIILKTIDAGHMGLSGENYYKDLAFQYSFMIDKLLT